MHAYLIVATGDRAEYHLMSSWLILGLLGQEGERTIRLVTDQPQRYTWFGNRVDLRSIDRHTMALWCGPNGYVCRSKLAALRESVAEMPDRDWTFLDCDISVRGPVAGYEAAVAAGERHMHLPEKTINRRRDGREFLAALSSRSWAGLKFDAQTRMWNSGVIGLPAGTGPRPIDTALEALDAIHASGFSPYVLEQLVLTVSMTADAAELAPADTWFAHYWGNKDEWLGAIAQRLAGWWQNGIGVDDAAAETAAGPLCLPTVVRKRRIHRFLPPLLFGSRLRTLFDKHF